MNETDKEVANDLVRLFSTVLVMILVGAGLSYLPLKLVVGLGSVSIGGWISLFMIKGVG